MKLNSRKFYLWIIWLTIVLVVFTLYKRISKTPEIKRDTTTETLVDSNFEQIEGKVGKVGDVVVQAVEKAVFRDLNKKTKVLEREWGFERLLHEEGDDWEIQKPFMTFFKSDFKCHLVADKGNVRVETAAGRTTPKDTELYGNVVIHILPEKKSRTKESFIYLDDITYISERSLFSTAGPVRFVAEGVLMLGRGLEFVYNEEDERLEFLEIIHLERLSFKASSKASLFSSTEADVQPSSEATDEVKTETKPRQPREKDREAYRCVFSKNVTIDTPEQLILADQITINDILFSKASDKKAATSQPQQADTVEVNDNMPITSRDEPNDTEELIDITVTCDGGIFIAPMDSKRIPEVLVIGKAALKDFEDTANRTMIVAERIEHNAATGRTVAIGPSELTFYSEDVFGGEPNGPMIPVKVSAAKKTTFLPDSKKIVFEGDSLCSMIRQDKENQREYTLSAPRLTVHLSREDNSAAEIEHMTADGGVVQLAVVKTAGTGELFIRSGQKADPRRLLGFTKLKCLRFDFDPVEQILLATGPGQIAVDNSRIPEPDHKVGKFSFERPCYVIIRDFDTLEFFLDSDRIVADAKHQQMSFGYVPVINGDYGRASRASAGHIEALIYETDDEEFKLSALNATGGITYKEGGEHFVGSQLFYDDDKALMVVRGDQSQPCLLNGASVDGIEYNLKTGKVKAKIVGPGMFQMGR